MRNPLFLIPLAIIGLTGCASVAVPTSQTTATQTTVSSTGYLTPEQSSRLVILPGDTTTPAQLEYLSEPRLTGPDDWRIAASGDPARNDATALMAGNAPR